MHHKKLMEKLDLGMILEGFWVEFFVKVGEQKQSKTRSNKMELQNGMMAKLSSPAREVHPEPGPPTRVYYYIISILKTYW